MQCESNLVLELVWDEESKILISIIDLQLLECD